MTGRHDAPPAGVLSRHTALIGDTEIIDTASGRTTHNWRIDTPTGSFLLRRLPAGLTADTAASIAAIHQHAAYAGLAPPLLVNDAGEMVTAHGGLLFILTRWVNDAAPVSGVPSVELSHQLGHTLGRLHQELREAAISDRFPRWQLPTAPTALREALRAHQQPGCPHHHARRTLQIKLVRAGAMPTDVRQRLDALDQQVIHGDIHPGNILIRAGQVVAMVDFDLARRCPPGYELVRALLYCTRPAGPPEAYCSRITAFLRGYLAARPLTTVEIDTMIVLYQAVQVLDPYGLHACDTADPDLLHFGHARFALLYWLARNGRLVTDLAHRVRRSHRVPNHA